MKSVLNSVWFTQIFNQSIHMINREKRTVSRGINHVGLTVPNLQQATEFLQKALDAGLFMTAWPIAIPQEKGLIPKDSWAWQKAQWLSNSGCWELVMVQIWSFWDSKQRTGAAGKATGLWLEPHFTLCGRYTLRGGKGQGSGRPVPFGNSWKFAPWRYRW